MAEAAHGRVPRQQGGGGGSGARRAHRHHGATEDVADAVRRPHRQLTAQARAELVEGVGGHRVLAHGGLELRGEVVQAVVEQERALDVWIHGKLRLQHVAQ